MTALSEERAGRFVNFLADGLKGTVVDIGCGWGELLLRVLAATPAARGLGIDTDETSIQHALHLAATRGLIDRVDLICGDARLQLPAHADAVVCIGASQIWGSPVEDNEPLDYTAALAAIRELLPRGARVIYGEGIWSRPPTAEAVATLAGRVDELVPLAQLVEIAAVQGFMPVAVHEANADEWDKFESAYSACYASWLAEHGPDHPDAAEVRALAARQRADYYNGYRGILGMAYLALLAV